MADRSGQQLGNYKLISLIGRGGFAEVYLGEHVRLKTQAAIKVLYTQLEHDDVIAGQPARRTPSSRVVQSESSRQYRTRRDVLIGLVGAGLTIGGGGIVWYELSKGTQNPLVHCG